MLRIATVTVLIGARATVFIAWRAKITAAQHQKCLVIPTYILRIFCTKSCKGHFGLSTSLLPLTQESNLCLTSGISLSVRNYGPSLNLRDQFDFDELYPSIILGWYSRLIWSIRKHHPESLKLNCEHSKWPTASWVAWGEPTRYSTYIFHLRDNSRQSTSEGGDRLCLVHDSGGVNIHVRVYVVIRVVLLEQHAMLSLYLILIYFAAVYLSVLEMVWQAYTL